MFELIDLDRKISKPEYKRRMPALQDRLLGLQQACWEGGIASIVVFEGWDAAGKGRCIRKLTERLEPRGFDLCHITDKPRTYELDLPWMWRFWTLLPRYGKLAIFDRSWNRRALIDRVELDAGELRWRRALRDIGDFERMLADDGMVLVKFFLHISKKEQKRRYDAWRRDPGMSWKALEGEWQKPTDYEGYLSATEELLQQTDSHRTPWSIVPATDHRLVRVEVLETIIARLEQALSSRGLEPPPAAPMAADDDDENGEEAGED